MTKKYDKFIAFILAIVLALGAFAIAAFAEDPPQTDQQQDPQIDPSASVSHPSPDYRYGLFFTGWAPDSPNASSGTITLSLYLINKDSSVPNISGGYLGLKFPSAFTSGTTNPFTPAQDRAGINNVNLVNAVDDNGNENLSDVMADGKYFLRWAVNFEPGETDDDGNPIYGARVRAINAHSIGYDPFGNFDPQDAQNEYIDPDDSSRGKFQEPYTQAVGYNQYDKAGNLVQFVSYPYSLHIGEFNFHVAGSWPSKNDFGQLDWLNCGWLGDTELYTTTGPAEPGKQGISLNDEIWDAAYDNGTGILPGAYKGLRYDRTSIVLPDDPITGDEPMNPLPEDPNDGNYDYGDIYPQTFKAVPVDIPLLFEAPWFWNEAQYKVEVAAYDKKKPVTIEVYSETERADDGTVLGAPLLVASHTYADEAKVYDNTDPSNPVQLNPGDSGYTDEYGWFNDLELDLSKLEIAAPPTGGYAGGAASPSGPFTYKFTKPGHLSYSITGVTPIGGDVRKVELSSAPIEMLAGDICGGAAPASAGTDAQTPERVLFPDGRIALRDRALMQSYINRTNSWTPDETLLPIVSGTPSAGPSGGTSANRQSIPYFLDLNGDGRISTADLAIMMNERNYNHRNVFRDWATGAVTEAN